MCFTTILLHKCVFALKESEEFNFSLFLCSSVFQVSNVQSLKGEYKRERFDNLVQDCSVSIANALEILQSCTKPSVMGDQK